MVEFVVAVVAVSDPSETPPCVAAGTGAAEAGVGGGAVGVAAVGGVVAAEDLHCTS